MKQFMRITALYLGIIGLVSLLAPQAASGQLGHALSAFDVFVARSLGAAIVMVALANWLLSSHLDRSTVGLLWSNIFMNGALAIVDVTAIVQKIIGPSSWFGVSVHGIIMVGSVFYTYRIYRAKNVKE